MDKKTLLASFVNYNNIKEATQKICQTLNLDESQLFIFELSNSPKEYILTYNIDSEYSNLKFSTFWKDTISIHRKKETNTLFSLNAMNELIKRNNKGVRNPNAKLNWQEYENCFLIVRKNEVVILPIKRIKTID